MAKIKDKYKKLKSVLRNMKSAVIAYSGGVDSTLLLKVAKEVLDDKVIAVTARSETYPASEHKEAKVMAKAIGVRHIIIKTGELKNKKFSNNPPDRCYHCKTELFNKLWLIAKKNRVEYVADGVNTDDFRDFRPGINAANELGVRHPLYEAGLTKNDIRRLSRKLCIVNWSKPAQACLASRIPYGDEITVKRLRLIEEAENVLRKANFSDVRVRIHQNIARLELDKDEMRRFLDNGLRAKIIQILKNKGVTYITLDLEGFRSGSMNEILP